MKFLSRYSLFNILVICIGVIGSVCFYSYISPWVVVMTDSTTYLRMAEEIQKGNWYIDGWIRGIYYGPPLFPAAVAVVEWIIPGFVKAGTIVSIISASAVVIPINLMASRLYGKMAGLIAIPLTILSSYYFLFAIYPLTESLFTVIFISGILLMLLALNRGAPFLWLLLGLTGGLAWMTRDVGITLPILSILWFAVWAFLNRSLHLKILKNGLLLVTGILLIYMPFMIVTNLDKRDIKVLPGTSISVSLMMPDLRDTTEREKYFGSLNEDKTEYKFVESLKNPPPLTDLIRNWDWIVKRLGINLYEVAKAIWMVLGPIIILLVLTGIVFGRKFTADKRTESVSPTLILGSCILLFVLFFAMAGAFTGAIRPDRYLTPVLPLFFIWSAAGISVISRYAGSISTKPVGLLFAVIILSGTFYFYYVPGLKRTIPSREYAIMLNSSIESLGARFREVTGTYKEDDIAIMAEEPFLSYHAGALWYQIPYGDYNEIIEFARNKKIDFFYLNRKTLSFYPHLAFLLHADPPVQEMKRVFLITYDRDPDNILGALYMVKK